MCRFFCWFCLGLATALWAAEEPPALQLAGPVQKIWDGAPHNAFTDLVRFKERWFCVFREGAGHAAGAGKIRVLTSQDGRQWTSAALVEKDNVDLRDPHLSITPDGRLMLNGGAAEPAARNPVRDHYSFVCFSRAGREWTDPKPIIGSWEWLWRVAWHNKTAYGVAYAWNPKKPDGKYHASLYKSSDGIHYEKVTKFAIPQATEAALAFHGDVLYCLQRRDGKPNTAMLGRSTPPYSDWTWKDLGVYYGGPHLIGLSDGSWWAAGRLMEQGKAKTSICRLDLEAGKLTPLLDLPSGGDTSYPGLVWHKNHLWVSYYSQHQGKSNIYLARLRKPGK